MHVVQASVANLSPDAARSHTFEPDDEELDELDDDELDDELDPPLDELDPPLDDELDEPPLDDELEELDLPPLEPGSGVLGGSALLVAFV